jgi:hypothetical protein
MATRVLSDMKLSDSALKTCDIVGLLARPRETRVFHKALVSDLRRAQPFTPIFQEGGPSGKSIRLLRK